MTTTFSFPYIHRAFMVWSGKRIEQHPPFNPTARGHIHGGGSMRFLASPLDERFENDPPLIGDWDAGALPPEHFEVGQVLGEVSGLRCLIRENMSKDEFFRYDLAVARKMLPIGKDIAHLLVHSSAERLAALKRFMRKVPGEIAKIDQLVDLVPPPAQDVVDRVQEYLLGAKKLPRRYMGPNCLPDWARPRPYFADETMGPPALEVLDPTTPSPAQELELTRLLASAAGAKVTSQDLFKAWRGYQQILLARTQLAASPLEVAVEAVAGTDDARYFSLYARLESFILVTRELKVHGQKVTTDKTFDLLASEQLETFASPDGVPSLRIGDLASFRERLKTTLRDVPPTASRPH